MVEFQNLVQPLFDEMMLGSITPREIIDQACAEIEARLTQ
jgi:ABC-type glycerol-3-phosphate transport system substrate-binding protein